MKKVIFSMAMLAMAAFTFVSCDTKGNAEGNNDGKDSANVEQTEEQKEVPVDQQTELECDHYLLKVPEGFKAGSRMVNSSCNMGLKEPPFVTAAPNFRSEDMAAFQADMEKNGCKAIDDFTAGDKTYKAFYMIKPDDNNCQHVYVATPQADGLVTIHFFTGASKMEVGEAKDALMKAVQTVIDNLTIK